MTYISILVPAIYTKETDENEIVLNFLILEKNLQLTI